MAKGNRKPENTEGYKKAMAAKGTKSKDRDIPKTEEEAASLFPWMGKYHAGVPEKLILHLSKGFSFESFGAEMNIGTSTLYRWLDDYPEFRQAKEAGEAKGLKLIESMAMSTVSGKAIKDGAGVEQFNPKLSNTNMLQFFMRTRFHKVYGDKKEIDHKSSDGSMKPTFVFEEYGGDED